jgi:NAD(P)-dependent dehydrogenase (short-subunit alcohol dehydrogenase family)
MAGGQRGAVVVTGAGGGVGSAACTLLTQRGYRVIGIDRARMPELVTESHHCDIGVPADLEAVLRRVGAAPDLVGLVNNAAVQHLGGVDELPLAAWNETLAVNLTAPFRLISSLAPALAANGGSVVNVASVHGFATTPGIAAYSVSKAALVGLTRAAALDLAPHRVRVNAVAPGAVDTAMLRAGFARRDVPGLGAQMEAELAALGRRSPLGRVAQSEEIAQLIAFLLDPEVSGFMTGQTLVADAGVLGKLSSE